MTAHSGIYIYITNNVILGYTPIFGSDNPEETNLLVLSFFPSLFEIMVPRSAKNQRCFDATEIPIEIWGTHMKNTKKTDVFCGMGDTRATPNAGFLKLVGRIKSLHLTIYFGWTIEAFGMIRTNEQ